MSVTINTPKSTLIKIDSLSGNVASWSIGGGGTQEAYEVLYKLKQDTSWSTMGKVNSSTQSYNLMNIYNKIGIKIQEFYYRIIIYTVKTESDGSIIRRKEFSEAYSVIFTNSKNGSLKVYDGQKVNNFPLFNEVNESSQSGENSVRSIKIKVDDSGYKKAPLVMTQHPLSGKLKIKTNDGIMAVAKETADFKSSGIYGDGYLYAYKKQYEEVYSYNYYKVYKYDKTTSYYAGTYFVGNCYAGSYYVGTTYAGTYYAGSYYCEYLNYYYGYYSTEAGDMVYSNYYYTYRTDTGAQVWNRPSVAAPFMYYYPYSYTYIPTPNGYNYIGYSYAYTYYWHYGTGQTNFSTSYSYTRPIYTYSSYMYYWGSWRKYYYSPKTTNMIHHIGAYYGYYYKAYYGYYYKPYYAPYYSYKYYNYLSQSVGYYYISSYKDTSYNYYGYYHF